MVILLQKHDLNNLPTKKRLFVAIKNSLKKFVYLALIQFLFKWTPSHE